MKLLSHVGNKEAKLGIKLVSSPIIFMCSHFILFMGSIPSSPKTDFSIGFIGSSCSFFSYGAIGIGSSCSSSHLGLLLFSSCYYPFFLFTFITLLFIIITLFPLCSYSFPVCVTLLTWCCSFSLMK